MTNAWLRFKTAVKKRAVAIATAGLAAVVALTSLIPGSPVRKALAIDPQFNALPGDYATLMARVNGQGNYTTDAVSLKSGDYVQFMLYAHNDVLNTAALNTRVRALLPTADTSAFDVTGRVWADNAPAVENTLPITLTGGAGHLVLDPATVQTQGNNNGVWSDLPTNNPSSVITAAGLNIGDIQGCWQYLKRVTFSARLVQPGNPDILTYKEVGLASVQNEWHRDGITTSPGNVVAYHIYIENNGSAGSTLVAPKVTDTLDSHLTYRPGYTYMITRDPHTGQDVRFDIPETNVVKNGQTITINFSDMPAQPANAFHLYFMATLGADTAFPVGTTRVLNTATTSGSGLGGALSKVTNQVFIDVVKNPAPVFDANIVKVVRNITTSSLWESATPVSASPGDTAQFELRVVNTGNQTTDVTVKDILPAHVTFLGTVLMKGAAEADTAYKTVPTQDLFGAGGFVKTAVLPGNVNGFVLRFNVTVDKDGFAAGPQTLTNKGQVYIATVLKKEATAALLVNATSAYTLQKFVQDPVDGLWKKDSVANLQTGDVVTYRIDVINTGNQRLSLDSIRDVLPQYMSYVPGTLVMDPQISPTPVTNPTAFFGTGITGFALETGVTKRFEYQVKVVDCPDLGTHTLVNTAFLKPAGQNEVNDQATIKLTVVRPVAGN